MSKVEKSRQWIGGRYEVAIPWKEEFLSLPDNREEAETCVPFREKPPQEARSCETLQRNNECEYREGFHSGVRI